MDFPFGNAAITAFTPFVSQPEWQPYLFPSIKSKRASIDDERVLVLMSHHLVILPDQ